MKTAPYNTGKVKIGEAVYLNKLVNQPYVEHDNDMLVLQNYLIHDPSQINRHYWITRLYLVVLVFVLTIVLLASGK